MDKEKRDLMGSKEQIGVANGRFEIEYSEKSNLLEHANYRYQLQEREDPNLYRYLFDYESIPKVVFNHRHVPVSMPKEIWTLLLLRIVNT